MPDAQDPCALATELRAARRKLLLGQRAVKVRYRAATGTEEETSFAAVDIKALDAEIRAQEAACDRLQGRRPRRFAITAG